MGNSSARLMCEHIQLPQIISSLQKQKLLPLSRTTHHGAQRRSARWSRCKSQPSEQPCATQARRTPTETEPGGAAGAGIHAGSLHSEREPGMKRLLPTLHNVSFTE